MTRDMPSISTSGTSTSTYGLANVGLLTQGIGAQAGQFVDFQFQNQAPIVQVARQAVVPDVHLRPKQEKPTMATTPRRLVQVFIADPDENIPLEQSLLYTGDQKLTDATDQELFFEIDMKTILEKHNAARVKLVNKKVKERVEHLEPVKIRELKMVVVNVATF